MFCGREADPAFVDVGDEGIGPREYVEAVFDPGLGAAELLGDADGALIVGFNERVELHSLFDGGDLRTDDVFAESSEGGVGVVAGSNLCGDFCPAEALAGEEPAETGDELPTVAPGSNGDGVQEADLCDVGG